MTLRRIGIYAGTFDPVHQGHISFCVAARQACDLEEIVLIPEARPRGKQQAEPHVRREALLRLATQTIPYLRVHTLRSHQFTIAETWPEIQQAFPGTHITLLIGSDVATASLKQWRDLASIVPEISFAIGLREGFVPGDVHTAMQELEAQLHARISYTVIQTPLPEAASSRIREGKQEHLVNEAATAYIRQHGLYPRRLSAESY